MCKVKIPSLLPHQCTLLMHRPRVDSIGNGEISIESKMSAPLGLHLIVSIIVLKDAFS